MTILLLAILMLGLTVAKPKYALIEIEDAPKKPIGVDAGLYEPGEPTRNKIKPAKGADYCDYWMCK